MDLFMNAEESFLAVPQQQCYDNSSNRDLEVNTSYALYGWRDRGRRHRRRR